jgi:hypothetical protein
MTAGNRLIILNVSDLKFLLNIPSSLFLDKLEMTPHAVISSQPAILLADRESEPAFYELNKEIS